MWSGGRSLEKTLASNLSADNPFKESLPNLKWNQYVGAGLSVK